MARIASTEGVVSVLAAGFELSLAKKDSLTTEIFVALKLERVRATTDRSKESIAVYANRKEQIKACFIYKMNREQVHEEAEMRRYPDQLSSTVKRGQGSA